MRIYPVKNNLIGKAKNYIGPYIERKRDENGYKTILLIRLPNQVRFELPNGEKKGWTNLAHAVV